MHTLWCVSNACMLIAHCSLFLSFFLVPLFKVTRFAFTMILGHVCVPSFRFIFFVNVSFSMKRFSISPPICTHIHAHSVLDSKRMSMRLMLFLRCCVCVCRHSIALLLPLPLDHRNELNTS